MNTCLRLFSFLIVFGLLLNLARVSAQAATVSVSDDANSITIDVPNRYQAIIAKGQTSDFIQIFDRAEDNQAPDLLTEFIGPHIREAGVDYMLRADQARTTSLVEATATRALVRVTGCFSRTSGATDDCLDDGQTAATTLRVSVEYAFTPYGVWVKNVTDFGSQGVSLDNAASTDGYNWLGVEVDTTDAAFADNASPAIYYGTGETENSTSTDGVAFENNNVYVTLPGQGDYQSLLVGITGWLDVNGGTDDWYWDENTASTTDTLTAREQGTTPLGQQTMSWFMRLAPQAELDSQSERQMVINDQRNPDSLTFTTGNAWQEVGSDDFNQHQGAYTASFSANQLRAALDGDSIHRLTPLWKIKHWRSTGLPESVGLGGSILNSGSSYNLSLQPMAAAYFAQDISFYTSLDSESASESPSIGVSGTVNTGVSFPAGRFGYGAWFDATGEDISYNLTEGTDYDSARGAIEFWLKPGFASDDDIAATFFNLRYDNDNMILLRHSNSAGSNLLQLVFRVDGTNSIYSLAEADYDDYWNIGHWLHIRVEWDDNASTSEQYRILLNGVEPTHTDSGIDYDATAFANQPNTLIIGNQTTGGSEPAHSLIDEFYLFTNTPTQIAAGGNADSSQEYLADTNQDFTFSFSADTTSNQGEYLYLGGEAKFEGINSNLTTAGSGSSPEIAWEYWNGNDWDDLSVAETVSGASNFTASGTLYFTAPGDWATYSFGNSAALYYLRAHLESGSYTTSPVEDSLRTDILTVQYLDTITQAGQRLAIPAEDPAITFSLSPVGIGETTNGITTSVASTFNSLPFGNLQIATPEYVAHQLYASTNAASGYTVTMKMLHFLQGNYPGNNIDPFEASWTAPTTWVAPTGTTPNIDTGWFGANTSDTRVPNWTSNTQGKFAGVTSSPVTVMFSNGADEGTNTFVTFALETNEYQPADLYSGTLVYDIIPTY